MAFLRYGGCIMTCGWHSRRPLRWMGPSRQTQRLWKSLLDLTRCEARNQNSAISQIVIRCVSFKHPPACVWWRIISYRLLAGVRLCDEWDDEWEGCECTVVS